MNNLINSIKKLYKKVSSNKHFKRYAIPGAVVLIGVIMLISAPWQVYIPGEELPTPTPTITPTLTPDVSIDTTPTPSPTPTTAPTEPPLPGVFHPLTGEPWSQVQNNRPWAISIGNYRQAIPHQGIAGADIIYEFITEGSDTRMIALYQDPSNVGVIGSIRSAREYMLEIAGSHDALLAHASGRLYGDNESELYGNPITRKGTLNVNDVWAGYRDTYRRNTLKMSREDTLVVRGDRIVERLPELDIRSEHNDSFANTLKFTQGTPISSGNAANDIEVRFVANSKTTSFSYSEDNKRYYVRQYNKNLVDTVGPNDSDIRLSFTNVLIIQTNIQSGANSFGHRRITTVGEGTGYFINGGKYIEIKWSREENKGYVYKNLDGTDLELGAGKTYICIIANNQSPIFS